MLVVRPSSRAEQICPFGLRLTGATLALGAVNRSLLRFLANHRSAFEQRRRSVRYGVVIDPTFRRQKIGQAVLSEAEQVSRLCEQVTCESFNLSGLKVSNPSLSL